MSSNAKFVGQFRLIDGKFVTVNRNRETYLQHKPVAIPATEMYKYYPLNPNSYETMGTLVRLKIAPGQTYYTVNGSKIVIEAKNGHVLFVTTNRDRKSLEFHIQTAYGFYQSWADVMRNKAARNLVAAHTFAHWEVQFLVGVTAGTSWKGLATVVGMDIFEEAITKEKTTSTKTAIRQLQIILTFKKDLKPYAPTLAHLIENVIWLSLIDGQKKHLLPSMTSDPKIAARAVGAIAAQIGKDAMDARVTVSSIVWSMGTQLVMGAAKAVPAAIENTIGQYDSKTPEEFAHNLEKLLATIDEPLTPAAKTLIAQEVSKHPQEISRAFTKMITAMNNPPS